MKIAIAVAVLALAGCASTDFGGIQTGSRVYDARIAFEAGATQAQTADCERQAREVFARTAGYTGPGAGAGNTNTAGLAFERCVQHDARKP